MDLRAYLRGGRIGIHTGAVVSERDPDTSGELPCVVIDPGHTAMIPLGFRTAFPGGFEFQIRPRSGMSFRTGLILPNAPGTIDADYRGEWSVLLRNVGSVSEIVRHGDRIAQAVLCALPRLPFVEGAMEPTARGAGGFGSTGSR